MTQNTERIESRANERILRACKLKQKKYRDESGLFCFEGIKLAKEAIAAGIEFTDIFALPAAIERIPALAGHPGLALVSKSIYDKLTDESSPDGIFCAARKPAHTEKSDGSKFMLCSVRDPGNVGTILRSAYAFGITEVILSSDCADLYAPKVVRAAMGALFRQPVKIVPDPIAEIDNLKKNGYNLCAAALTPDAVSLGALTVDSKTCFVVGNEGHGLDEAVIAACDRKIIIPMQPNAESLNVSVAASVLMWEIKRNVSQGYGQEYH